MVKVSIFGSTGTIGKNVAFALARQDTVDEIVMISRPESLDKVKGETYDMYDALAARDIDCRLTPTCDFNDIEGSAIVLISAGAPRKKGMKRLDLALTNAKIVAYYSRQVAKYAPDAIILQLSSTEPPPRATTTSALHSMAMFRPSSTISIVGSEEMLWNMVYFIPCSSRECNIFSCSLSPNIVSSVTSSTDLNSFLAQISPTSVLFPKPSISFGLGNGTAPITLPGTFLIAFLST